MSNDDRVARRRQWQHASNARRVRKSVSMTRAQSEAVAALAALEDVGEFSPLAKKALAVLAEKHGIQFPDGVKEDAHD